MGESVSGVSSGNRTTETSSLRTDTSTTTTTRTNNSFTNTATSNNLTGAQERRLFNQEDVTRTNLQARTEEIPRMDATSERRLAQINPQLANRIRRTAADLRAQGINVMVTSGFRSFAEQNELYAQGRTKPGNIVTNARGGQSLHNYGLAADLVPLDSRGQPNWNVPNSTWQTIGAAGKRQGLEWGGDWTGFVDRPHFQMTAGRSTSSLLAQYNQNGGNLNAIWNDVNSHYPNIGPNTPTTPTTPTNPTNPTTPTGNNLSLNSRGAAVTQLQRDLTRLGYRLEDDGIFGRQTDAAVKRFQRDHNLTADGIVGPRTRAAIDRAKQNAATPVPTARLSKGSNGAQVRQLQTALVRLGFMTQGQMNTGPGTFGPHTDAALRAFQRSQGLTADGIYGPRSQAALRTALGGTAPTTPTTPTNPSTASGARINDILRGTNLAGQGDLIARLSRQYNIPAELALAMFRKEASFATDGSLAARNNNPGNIRFVGQEGATRGAGGFARWNSMEQGIEAYFGLLDRGYRSFIDRQDWAGLVNKYAPPVENNSTQYTQQITQWMGEYRQRLN